MSHSYIDVLLGDGRSVQILADVDIEVFQDDYGSPTVHVADVIKHVILEKTKTQESATLYPGKYTVRLMATVVGEEGVDELPHS